MFNMGPMEIGLILIVALFVVGPKKLPELGKTLGKTMREFRKVQDELRSSIDLGIDDQPSKPTEPDASRFEQPPMRRRGRSMVPRDEVDEVEPDEVAVGEDGHDEDAHQHEGGVGALQASEDVPAGDSEDDEKPNGAPSAG